jgi:UDP-glucose 4-epimerase
VPRGVARYDGLVRPFRLRARPRGALLPKRILVTGGAGFIGSHVCERLLDDKHVVEIVDDLSTGKRENVPPGAVLHTADVRSPETATIIRDGKFDAVIHLAAQMDVRKSVADPLFDASVNILGGLNVLEAVHRSVNRQSCRVVAASTGGAVYGDLAKPPNVETFIKNPESPYAVSKLSVEYYLAYYGRVHGLDAVALRYGNVYGPRQNPHGEAGVVAIFCGRLLDRRPLTIFGDGTQTRDYVYAADVAAATVTAVTHRLPPPGDLDSRAFNVGTGVGTSVLELARLLKRVAGVDVEIEHAPNRRGEQQHSFLNVDKARATLGWRPALTLEQGLTKTYEWYASPVAMSNRA